MRAKRCASVGQRWLTCSLPTDSVEQRVEWLYAFDVHCNAFVPFFAILYAAQV